MNKQYPTYVVTGTDTDIGKTVVSAILTVLLHAVYYKPVQAGTEGGTDTERVRAMTGLNDTHFLPERFCLKNPLSPHLAAELEQLTIEPTQLDLPSVNRPLVVEGAGGVLVPINRQTLYADIFAQWQVPVVICARTRLGGINHALLTIEALQTRNIPIHGLIFIGDDQPDTVQSIVQTSGVRSLGRLPILSAIDQPTIVNATQYFSIADFIPQ